MPVTHEPWLVALSLFLAIQGSFVGLSLAVQVAGEMLRVLRGERPDVLVNPDVAARLGLR